MSFVKGDFCSFVVSSSEVEMISSFVVVGFLGLSCFHTSLLFSFSCVMRSNTVSNRNCAFIVWMSTMAAVMNGGRRMLFEMGALIFTFVFPGRDRRWCCSFQLMKISILGTSFFLVLKMCSGLSL